MKKGWKIVGAVVLIVVVIGAILAVVGVITGADAARIYSILDDRFVLTAKYEWLLDVIARYKYALSM